MLCFRFVSQQHTSALIREYQRRGIIQDPKHWCVDDMDGTTLLYQEQQYISDDMDLRRSIVQRYHMPQLRDILVNLPPL